MVPLHPPHVLLVNWQMLVTEGGHCPTPQSADGLEGWIEASAPGTAMTALRAAGLTDQAYTALHGKDVWWRCALHGLGAHTLEFDGLATIAEVWLDLNCIATSRSMYLPFSCRVNLTGPATLYLCCRSLADAFERKLPRARWRTRLVSNAGLRGVRTTLLGQVASFMPKGDVVGPWRPIRLVKVSEGAVCDLSLLADLDLEGHGRLKVSVRAELARTVKVRCLNAEIGLTARGDGAFEGELVIEGVDAWWPHTHGTPSLHDVVLEIDGQSHACGKTGFRRLEVDRGRDGLGFGLKINGQSIFSRGACWVSPDAQGLAGGEAVYRPLLEAAKAAGMNLIRMSGVGAYEESSFYEVCDALGLMVWQDFMFANFDYPIDDPEFAAQVRGEAEAFLRKTRRSPSLVVFCGGSEMLQQATMMGLSPDRCRSALIDEVLPDAVQRLRPNTVFVENSPFGATLPFHTNTGVTHYFGVGAYMRPVEDARRARVRFTAECLAFSNLPSLETHRTSLGGAMPDAADWRLFVPKDAGADWDFEDVRDHYLQDFSGTDPKALKVNDPGLYHDLSCETVNDLVTRTFWEWRREGSSCAGALVWLFQDLMPGAGWGLLDAGGRPKAIYYAAKRVWQSLHIGLTDEGLNGLDIHIVNEMPAPAAVDLELSCWRADGTALLKRSRRLNLNGRDCLTLSAIEIIGAFFDLTYAYRFGPRAHDGVTVSLRDGADGRLLSQAHYYPPGADYLLPCGLAVRLDYDDLSGWSLDLETNGPLRGLFIDAPGWRPSDDGFDMAPEGKRQVWLTPEAGVVTPPVGRLRSRGAILAHFG